MLDQSAPDHFSAARGRGVAALRRGDLAAALDCFDEALDVARASGDGGLVDLAVCNRSAILIELGEGAERMTEMRDVLMRSRDLQTCMVAATNVARFYDLEKAWKKALFYARLALEHASVDGDASQRASIHNLIANLLLADSRVDEAASEYEVALGLMPDEDPVWRARAVGNLGYCRILQHRLRDAFSLLDASLETLRQQDARPYLVSPLSDLAFAHLEVGQLEEARATGTEALALAREFNDQDGVKNALYLLGQTAGLAGDADEGRRFFQELQERYYPDKPFVCDFLLSVDVRQLVNLRA